jgi:hypothetical protein
LPAAAETAYVPGDAPGAASRIRGGARIALTADDGEGSMALRAGTPRSSRVFLMIALAAVALVSCSSDGSNDVAGPDDTLLVELAGNGQGRVVDSLGLIDCPGACGPQSYIAGERTQLTPTPEAGSSFGGWSGSCTGADPGGCVLDVTGHMVVQATFNSP